MSDDKPWLATGEDLAAHQGRADDWWARAKPADLRRLWDYVTVQYADEVLDATTNLAQLMFLLMVQRFPTLKIGDSS